MRWFATLSQPIRTLLASKPLGRRGEDAAARYLRRRGYIILARGRPTIEHFKSAFEATGFDGLFS